MTLTEGGVDLLIGINGCRRKGNAADYDTRSMLSVQMDCLRPGTVSPCGIIGNILRVSERYIEGGGSKLGLEGARNSSYTRRTWRLVRLDAGVVVDGVVGGGLASVLVVVYGGGVGETSNSPEISN